MGLFGGVSQLIDAANTSLSPRVIKKKKNPCQQGGHRPLWFNGPLPILNGNATRLRGRGRLVGGVDGLDAVLEFSIDNLLGRERERVPS